jgi:hypothetical protein
LQNFVHTVRCLTAVDMSHFITPACETAAIEVARASMRFDFEQ